MNRLILEKALSRMGLVLGSLAVFWMIFEAAVRLWGPELAIPRAGRHFQFTQSFEFQLPHHLRDPVLGWRLQPGRYGRMRVNSRGFRGPEFTGGEEPGELRIALLGDSITMGFTVPEDRDVYGRQLEILLARRGIASRVFDLGVDGYSSYQGRLLAGRILPEVHPDVVTFLFGYNDHHYADAPDADTSFAVSPLRNVFEKSHAYRFLRRQILLSLPVRPHRERPRRRVDLDAFQANLEAMVDQARSLGARPLLMTTPLREGRPLTQNEVLAEVDGQEEWVTQDWWLAHQLEAGGIDPALASGTQGLAHILDAALERHPDWPYLHFIQGLEMRRRGEEEAARAAFRRAMETDAERRLMEAYNRRVHQVGQERNVKVVDLARLFSGRPQAELFNDVVHPTAEGHRLIARALAEAVLQEVGGGSPDDPAAGRR
ncbi:MAG: SGNH/GDSL hydrolase family protein [Acidobacteriota bacterium]